jgi:UDP-glucose 4-epimerase
LISLKNKRVLVTGGAGFLGSYLCENLLKYELEKIIIVDNFSLGKLSNLDNIKNVENLIIYKKNSSNLLKMNEILDKENIDVVFNLAVIPLPMSLISPKKTIDTNILITSTLCELLRLNKFSTLIHISSSEAYGSSLYAQMSEEHPTYPITPYAASKLACDHIVLSYSRTFNLDTSIIRPFNMYGPRQNEKSYAGVIPLTIMRILNGECPIINGDGLQTRDYSFVEDIASVIPKFYEEKCTRNKVINLATGHEITIKYLIEKIANLMEYQGEIKYTSPRPGDVRRHVGDITLAQKLFNYEPKTSLDDGLKLTINWYKNMGR